MRRLWTLVRGLPLTSTLARRLAEEIRPEPQPAAQKVDYDALRKLGGEIITVPRS